MRACLSKKRMTKKMFVTCQFIMFAVPQVLCLKHMLTKRVVLVAPNSFCNVNKLNLLAKNFFAVVVVVVLYSTIAFEYFILKNILLFNRSGYVAWVDLFDGWLIGWFINWLLYGFYPFFFFAFIVGWLNALSFVFFFIFCCIYCFMVVVRMFCLQLCQHHTTRNVMQQKCPRHFQYFFLL